MNSIVLVYLIAPVFLFIFLFAGYEYKRGAFVIFFFSTVNLIAVEGFDLLGALSYEQAANVVMLWDSITLLTLCFFIRFNFFIVAQVLLLAFAVTCHIMLLYDLTKGSNAISNIFYSYYDELIITIGIAQIMAATNGFITASIGLREHLLWSSFCRRCASKSLRIHKKDRGST